MERHEDIAGHLTTEELFRQHAPFVTRFLARCGVPAELLDDALQEVFLVVHRNGGYRPGVAKPTSYLASIAIRGAAAHRRREGVSSKRHSEAAVEELQSGSEDPAHALQVRQDLAKLQSALAKLPLDLRAVLVLVEIEGESCLSVAAGLGCPVGTVYWRLHEARKQLQSALVSADVTRRKWRPTAAEPNERAVPARSFMMLFGLHGFNKSEAQRLLQLAREPSTQLPLEGMLERHQQLVASGAELPAWAASYVPHSTSWLSLIGTGPAMLGVALGGAALAVALVTHTKPASPPPTAPLVAAERAEPNLPDDVKATIVEEMPAAPKAQVARETASERTGLRRQTDAPGSVIAERANRDAHRVNVRAAEADVARKASASSTGRSGVAESHGSAPRESPAPTAAESAQSVGDEKPKESAAESPSAPKNDEAEETRGPATPDKELTEMRQIAQAESLLPRDPARALALTHAMQRRFQDGYFLEERAYVEVMALSKLGRTGELREKANAFLRAYPNGPYSERVKMTVGQ